MPGTKNMYYKIDDSNRVNRDIDGHYVSSMFVVHIVILRGLVATQNFNIRNKSAGWF